MTVYIRIQVENRKAALPTRVLNRLRVQLAYQNARQYRVKPAMFYAAWCYKLRTTDLQRSAGGRDSLGNLGYSSQVQCSLVHRLSHAQLFVACRTSLAVRQVMKSWAWDWERGYHELETADRQ